MRSLLRFLIRYHPTILFLLLEVIAIVLVSRYNSYHQARVFKIRHAILGSIARRYDNLSTYFSLVDENKALAEENARLYNALPADYFNPLSEYTPDTSADRRYYFIPARVINNSVNKQYNFITLNAGTNDGVEAGMAVICDRGIVGEVKEATENFSSVISVLNRESFPNAMIKRNGYFGPVEWPGRNYRKVILTQIPSHVDVHVGDTIVTSGYSYTFPRGILVGTVESYKLAEGISYDITVRLAPDFKNLSNVLVVKNLMRDEQEKVERSQEND